MQKEDRGSTDNPDREKKLLDVLKSAQDERDRLDSKVRDVRDYVCWK